MKQLSSNIINAYGKQGREWLAALPERLRDLANRYGLESVTPMSNLNMNYVASAYQQEKAVVIKLALDPNMLMREASALQAFKNGGCVDVLIFEEGVLLLQKAQPGTALKTYFPHNDEEATRIAAVLMKSLHATLIPEKHPFKHVRDLVTIFNKDLGIPKNIIQKAKSLASALLETAPSDVLLHGDLHHENILKNEEKWVVIDPKGYVGDPAFETATFIANPLPLLMEHEPPQKMISHRIELFSDILELSEQRIKDWLYVKLVLCWSWTLDANSDPKYWESVLRCVFE